MKKIITLTLVTAFTIAMLANANAGRRHHDSGAGIVFGLIAGAMIGAAIADEGYDEDYYEPRYAPRRYVPTYREQQRRYRQATPASRCRSLATLRAENRCFREVRKSIKRQTRDAERAARRRAADKQEQQNHAEWFSRYEERCRKNYRRCN